MSGKRRLSIARLERGGKRYEIIVDVEKAWLYKNGEKLNVREIMEGEFIYYDANRGLKASESELKKVFGTDNIYSVAEIILKQGELLLTTEQRRELIEQKKRQIIELISRNAVDPRTNAPIPAKRIELALEEARVSIDPFKPAELQVPDVIKALRMTLPMKIMKAIMAVYIPAAYVGKAYHAVSKMGKVLRENYRSDGSLDLEIEVPAGLQSSIVEKVASLTKGSGDVKLIRMEPV
ncbi:ribosome assembly factor SBDS [Thermofilum pendens]|uniref:Shwachman-Bodian-Diamond syndrome protein n=1 Tax=Thermofilum pendens (strain DSM 2475 / Hrk 5) TaxID=368408 RepID=A1RXQ8_THEPD|nr:ribosome assembly factor SBDS [Thermofilum pendens]ABL77988.1 Shwachman-Bodian-Diamond syndrome protein [Thermofilum pendens Hrk 5]